MRQNTVCLKGRLNGLLFFVARSNTCRCPPPEIYLQTSFQHFPAPAETDGAPAQPFQMGAQVQVVPLYVVGATGMYGVPCPWNQ